MKKLILINYFILSGLVFIINGFLTGCGKHDIENFGYTRQLNAEVADAAVTWQDRFELAVNQNNLEDVQALLSEADDEAIDFAILLKNGRTPLTHAVVSGSTFIVYLVLQKNIDVHFVDGLGKSAMDYAAELNKERVKLLLEPDLQMQLQDEFYLAVQNEGEDVASLVKAYLEAGVDPNFIYEKTGETPLTQAIKIKSIAVLQIIRWTDKELGLTATNINLPNVELKKPLAIAIEIKLNKVIKALEDLSAEVN